MRDQYVGDANDLIKFALLRALAGDDRSLGVAWYYNPANDGRPDGRHVEWRDSERWKKLDDKVFADLASLETRSVHGLERLGFWPQGSTFFREPVSRFDREGWAARMAAALRDADIVFCDPDTGFGRQTARHATFGEINRLASAGQAIVLISFPARRKVDSLLTENVAGLRCRAGIQDVATLMVSLRLTICGGPCPPRRCWFTLLNADDALLQRACRFADMLNKSGLATAQLRSRDQNALRVPAVERTVAAGSAVVTGSSR